MTLAVAILFLGISSTAFSPELKIAQDQSVPPAATSPSTDTKATTPEQSDQKQSTAQKSTKAKKRSHNKKAVAPGCGATASTASSGSNSSTPSASASSSVDPPGDSTATQNAGKNCPPEKIIVRQGGTAEPSIQLAGGDQAAQKRDAANRMLGSTEVNLKKISGQQLTAAQQDTVSQIRQFVDQSKAALAAGDLERGRTLAWKAQLLSEDLVNPPK